MPESRQQRFVAQASIKCEKCGVSLTADPRSTTDATLICKCGKTLRVPPAVILKTARHTCLECRNLIGEWRGGGDYCTDVCAVVGRARIEGAQAATQLIVQYLRTRADELEQEPVDWTASVMDLRMVSDQIEAQEHIAKDGAS